MDFRELTYVIWMIVVSLAVGFEWGPFAGILTMLIFFLKPAEKGFPYRIFGFITLIFLTCIALFSLAY